MAVTVALTAWLPAASVDGGAVVLVCGRRIQVPRLAVRITV
jgi:hypothetical protein